MNAIVDRDVLPYLMRAIEGFVFGRGFAYRQGGDEYLVSIPNVEHSEALEFFESLRKHIETIVYQKTLKITNPTISIGVVTVDSFDRKTASELLQLANKFCIFN